MSGRSQVLFFSTLLAMTWSVQRADAGELRSGIWTSFQHDLQRTGRTDGKGAVSNPTVAWKVPVGGALRSDSYVTEILAAPLESDGRTSVLTIAAGRVRATRSDGTEIWRTPIGSWVNILGVWNVDGKGAPEVLIDQASSVAVLDGSTGALLRTLPSGSLLQAAFVPVDATSGAGLVILQSSRGSITTYDFRDGISAAKSLWTAGSYFQTTMAVADVDGDSKPEIIRTVETGFEALDPLTGTVKYSAASIGARAYYYGFYLANVDGKPGDEIVAFDDSYTYSPTTGVFVLGVDAGSLKTLWSEVDTATAVRERDHFSVTGSATDLDGDGKTELVYSRWDGSKWATRIVDAATGTVLSTLDGVGVEAVADIDGDGKVEIVAKDLTTAERLPTHSTLRAWDFDSRTTGAVPKSWSVPRAQVAVMNAALRPGRAVWMDVPIAADFDPATNGTELVVEQVDMVASNPPKLLVVKGDGSTFAEVTWDSGATGTALWFGDKLSSASSTNELLAFGSDGLLRSMAGNLSTLGTQRTGTYAGFSQVLPASGDQALIVNTTSARQLRAYDGSRLEPDGTPRVVWRVNAVVSTAAAAATSLPWDPVGFLPTKDKPRFVTYEGRNGATSVVARDALTGTENWRVTLPVGTGVAAPGAYPFDLNADGTSDVMVWQQSTSGLALVVYDGQSGALLKTATLASMVPGGDQFFPGSLVDLDGDSIPELVGSIHALGMAAVKVSASPMTALWSIPKQFNSWNGIVGAAELDGDPEVDLFRVNGGTSFGHYMRLDAKGTVDAHIDPGTPALADQDRNPAALVRRDATTFDLVTTGMRDIGLSRVRRFRGDTLEVSWEAYASGGKVTDLPPSERVTLGAPVVADVDGDGTDEVVFGGGDGWLYALRATDGKPVFTMDLGVPVDRVIIANVDADPELEVLATLADGNLIAVDGDGKYATIVEPSDAGVDGGGVDAATDAATDAAADAGPGDEVEGGGGCGCSTAGHAGVRLGLVAFATAVSASIVRRRRRS